MAVRPLLLTTICALLVSSAATAFERCVADDGGVTYQDTSCPAKPSVKPSAAQEREAIDRANAQSKFRGEAETRRLDESRRREEIQQHFAQPDSRVRGNGSPTVAQSSEAIQEDDGAFGTARRSAQRISRGRRR